MSIQVISTTDSKEAASITSALAVKDSTVEEKPAPVKADETIEASEALEDGNDDKDEVSASEKENHEDDEETQGEDKKPKKSNGFKKRIDKLNRRLTDKDQELEYWKQEALKGKSSQEAQVKDAPKVEATKDGKPKADNFDTHEEYVEALTDWKLDQKEKERETKTREAQVKTEYQKQVESFQTKVKEFQKTTEDFGEVMSDIDDIPLSLGLQESIMTSDMAPELMYTLAKNRKELERINALSPLNIAREIGKIEVSLAKTSDASTEKSDEPKTTKAPPPLRPVGASGSAKTAKSLSDPNISQADYERLRREQIAKRMA